MKTLVAPLNWGLGHASRCVALIKQLLLEGDEVAIAGDGLSITYLKKHFPKLICYNLPPLNIKYSSSDNQTFTLLKQIPKTLFWAIQDHYALKQILNFQHFDRVISDNRFFFYGSKKCNTKFIYLTHQPFVHISDNSKIINKIAQKIHISIIKRYSECWIPDFEQVNQSLSGELSHNNVTINNIKYIGPLSRFKYVESKDSNETYDVVAVLSGIEPQRTIFENQILNKYSNSDNKVLIVRGLINKPYCKITHNNITIVPYISDSELKSLLIKAKKIISRSGYSTIMDFWQLGVLQKAELVPTKGQKEQEYLAYWLKVRHNFDN